MLEALLYRNCSGATQVRTLGASMLLDLALGRCAPVTRRANQQRLGQHVQCLLVCLVVFGCRCCGKLCLLLWSRVQRRRSKGMAVWAASAQVQVCGLCLDDLCAEEGSTDEA